MSKKKLPVLWIVIAVVVVLVVVQIIRQQAMGPKSSGEGQGAYDVVVASVTCMDIPVIERVTGVIEADPQVKVFPRAAGRIERIKCHPGDVVKKGQVLVLIDRDVPGMNYSLHQVESPINGTVLEVYGEVGTQVAPTAPVAQVGNLDKVKLVTYVTEVQIGSISPGQNCRVTVDSLPDRIFEGQVQTISKILEAPQRKAQVEIAIKSHKGLLTPGIIARADTITAIHRNAFVVPEKAVLEGDKGTYLATVTDNHTRFIPVTVGPTYKGLTELTSGANEGDVVIVEGGWGMSENAEVKVIWQRKI